MPSASGPVVSYRNSTSNHNVATSGISAFLLYLIEILHQTTTGGDQDFASGLLYLIEILHQTTTCMKCLVCKLCCILSKFYIKPQHCVQRPFRSPCCILSKFYIKPQPSRMLRRQRAVVSYRNSTSNHNTDPREKNLRHVVSYRNSTSNHNSGTSTPNSALLYLIEILHQTTTIKPAKLLRCKLYLIEILHQTTTFSVHRKPCRCCILSKFYIKPQHVGC